MAATTGKQLLTVLLPASGVLAAVGVAAAAGAMPVPDMTRDLAALAGLHPLAGVLSNLGLILWTATAAICVFVATSMQGIADAPRSRFVLFGGLLSACMLFDDFFQFHEVISPQYLGVRERYVYLLLATALGSYLIVFRDVIATTRWTLLGLALGLFAASASADAAVALLMPGGSSPPDWQFFLEDGAKWLGICCWFGYFWHVCRDLRPAPALASDGVGRWP